MIIDYSASKLEIITRDFYNISGVNISILDDNFKKLNYKKDIPNNPYCTKIQSLGHEGCRMSDEQILQKCKENGEPVFHVCHAGLLDIAIPIINEEKTIGYIILGQIKKKAEFPFSELEKEYSSENFSRLSSIYENLPIFDERKINSVINVSVILAKHILLEKLMRPKSYKTLETAVNFINEHLSESLSVDYISKETHISKSSLYNIFHIHYGVTISEYVNKARIEHSKELMMNSDLSMENIAYASGFSSLAYFSRVFKAEEKISPTKYKQNLKKRQSEKS